MQSVNCILITGAPAWRWLGEYMILDKTFNLMVTLHPFLADFLHGGPIGWPRSAERVIILHTLYDRDHASF